MSKINIEGIVKDINVRTTYLTPLVEAVCNSIDAIGNAQNGKIDIVIKRAPFLPETTTRAAADIMAVDIIDNGVGFNKENRESFDTYKSGMKADIGGKGFGRFMYLKYFDDVTIESIYQDNGEIKQRRFRFGKKDNIIIDETEEPCSEKETGTVLHLAGAKKNKITDKGIDVIARKLVEKLLVFFVDKKKPAPIITIREEDNSEQIVLNSYIGPDSNIVSIGEENIEVASTKTGEFFEFQVQVYKIYYSSITSRISLTANKREVTDTQLHQYIPEFKETLFEVASGKQKNYTVKAYVLGQFLDANVTVERDGFKICSDKFGEKGEGEIFSDITEEDIERKAAQVVKNFFAEEVGKRSDEKRTKVLNYINSSAPWHRSIVNDLDMDSMPMGISSFDIEMRLQKAKFNREQEIRITLHELQDAVEKNEGKDDLQTQVKELSEKISIATKNDLVHYVCNRKKVIDMFDALRKRRADESSHLESELHNLIYPMGFNSEQLEYEDHNLWIIDERLSFSKFTASDQSNYSDSNDAPDLVHFFDNRIMYRNGENTVVSPVCIVEFKRPKRTNYTDSENPIIQACRYARKIQEGKYELPEGIEPIKADKLNTPVYIYVVCDIVPKIEEFADNGTLTKSPDGERYFGYNKNYNAYIEVVSYKSLIEQAKMRNAIFFEKLKINI